MNLLDIIAWPFSYVFQLCYMICKNYAVALFLFALFVKILLLPLGIKQQKNSIKSAKLRPQLYIIEKKYAGRTDKVTLQKKQQEILDFQSKNGASPLSGCLPLLIQLPIVLGLYQIVRKPLTWLCRFKDEVIVALNSTATGNETAFDKIDQISLIPKIHDMGADAFSGIEGFDYSKLPNLTMWGRSLGETPKFAFGADYTWLFWIPIVVFITSYLSMILTRKLMAPTQPQQTKDQQLSMKIMDFTMPLFSMYICYRFSAALGLYWIYQTVVGVLQSVILAKLMPLPTFTNEQLRAIEKEMKKKGYNTERVTCRDDNKPVRSLHYIDEDDDDVPAPVQKPKNGNGKSAGKSQINRPNLKK